MKHVVLFGKVFYITTPTYGDKLIDDLAKEFYWLVGIHETPIFGGLENVIIDKHITGEIYNVTFTGMLLSIVFMWGLTWWLPIILAIVLGLKLYGDLKMFGSTVKMIVERHHGRVTYSKLSWKEKMAKDKEAEKFYEEIEKLTKEIAEEEENPKD